MKSTPGPVKLPAKSGRPPKFREPRRPITVTLPESVLHRLACVDPDRARAIVKVTNTAVDAQRVGTTVELVEVLPGMGIIIVGPSQLLRRITWLRMVEVAPLRYLLTLQPGTSIDSLELAVLELIDEVKPGDDWELTLLTELKDLIRGLRKRGELSKAELLLVNTAPKIASRGA